MRTEKPITSYMFASRYRHADTIVVALFIHVEKSNAATSPIEQLCYL